VTDGADFGKGFDDADFGIDQLLQISLKAPT